MQRQQQQRAPPPYFSPSHGPQHNPYQHHPHHHHHHHHHYHSKRTRPIMIPSSASPPLVLSSTSSSASSCSGSYPERVSTPWIRNLALDNGISLGIEVLAFGTFMRPTAEEQSGRDGLRRVLQHAVACYCSHSTVKLIGSCGIGVGLPWSELDLVVEGWTGSADEEKAALARLADAGYPSPKPGHRPGSYLLGPAASRIEFCPDTSPERKLVHNLKRRMDAHEASVRAVTLVIRTLLQQSNLGGDEKEGLSGSAVALMVAAVAADVIPTSPPPPEVIAAVLLKEVLRIYSKWAWKERSVVLVGYNTHQKAHPRANVSICSPFDATANLGEKCKREVQISAMMRYALLGLAQWDAGNELPEAMKNSRGVTPLSSIIAHKELWDRSHLIRRVFPTHPSSSDLSLSSSVRSDFSYSDPSATFPSSCSQSFKSR